MVLFLEFLSGRRLGIGAKDVFTFHYYSDAEQAVSEYDEHVYKHAKPTGIDPDIGFLLIEVYGNVTLLQPEAFDTDEDAPEYDPHMFTPNVRVNSSFKVIKYDEGNNVRFIVEQKQQIND
jgi:hypothetical protein